MGEGKKALPGKELYRIMINIAPYLIAELVDYNGAHESGQVSACHFRLPTFALYPCRLGILAMATRNGPQQDREPSFFFCLFQRLILFAKLYYVSPGASRQTIMNIFSGGFVSFSEYE